MQTVIVDTDIAIDYLRGVGYAGDLMFVLWDSNTAFLSILSVYELYAGMRKGEEEDTDNFINACCIEPVTIEITRRAGNMYRQKGLTLTSIDCLVNATAVIKSHKIATRNKNHYPNKKILLAMDKL